MSTAIYELGLDPVAFLSVLVGPTLTVVAACNVAYASLSERRARRGLHDLNRALSVKYGRTIEHCTEDVWLVDGRHRRAVLTDALTLVVSGRELGRQAT